MRKLLRVVKIAIEDHHLPSVQSGFGLWQSQFVCAYEIFCGDTFPIRLVQVVGCQYFIYGNVVCAQLLRKGLCHCGLAYP